GIVDRAVIEDLKLSLAITAVQLLPAHHRIWKLEGAVLKSFRIETAISAEVDILEEETEECVWNCGTWLVDLHGYLSRLCGSDLSVNKCERKQDDESSKAVTTGNCS